MRFHLATWRPTRLLLAWCGYWVALLLASLGPSFPAVWRATRPDAHGSIDVSFGSAGFHVGVIQDAVTVWSRDVSFMAVSLWLAVPPLVLWVFWLRARRAPESVSTMRAV